MDQKKIMENMFKKETFINNIKATYEDLVWLLVNIFSNKDFLRKVINKKTRLFVYTI